MKKIFLSIFIAACFVASAYAGPCKVGDRVRVGVGYLVFNDRHKQEQMAEAHAGPDAIKQAIEDGECVMLKHPIEATIVDEVGQEIKIEQDGGAQWWTTKMAVTVIK
jgi:hypothetical protein